MMLSADQDGNLPDNPQVLTKLCRLDSVPNLQVFEELGFLEGVTGLYTECTQNVNNLVTECENEVGTVLAHKTIDIAIEHEHDSPIPFQKGLSKDNPKKFSPSPVALPDQIQLFQDAYNAVAGEIGLPSCRTMTKTRQAKLVARIKDHGPQGLAAALDALRLSNFCQGDNDRGWRADIDFVLQERSCAKLLEGAYASSEPKSNMQKAMELIDAEHVGENSGRNGPTAGPIIPEPGEGRPKNLSYSDCSVDEIDDWAG